MAKAKKAQTPYEMLDALGVDALCDRFVEGESYGQIAESMGIRRSSIANWVAARGHSARVREAVKLSAQLEDERALEAIIALRRTEFGPDGQPIPKGAADIASAREEAQHRRWRAKARDPDTFGDRLKLETEVKDLDTAALLAEARAIRERLGDIADAIAGPDAEPS